MKLSRRSKRGWLTPSGELAASVTLDADGFSTQNALPIWHTHSTVTGSATALGIKGMPKSASALAASIPSSTTHKKQHSIDDADIAAHFVDLVEEDDGDDEFEDVQPGTGVAVKREIEVETNGATNGEPSSPMLKGMLDIHMQAQADDLRSRRSQQVSS